MISRRTSVNYSALLDLNFEPHELLMGAHAVWASENANFLVSQFTLQ